MLNNNLIDKYLQEFAEVGFVKQVTGSVVAAEGLPYVTTDEQVIFENGAYGKVLSLDHEMVEILLLSSTTIKSGMKVARMGRKLGITISEEMLGQIIDPLGRLVSAGGKTVEKGEWREVEKTPSGMVGRKKISRRFSSGVMMVDLMIPIGKGQRELIIGDRKTGKSLLLLQSVLTQAREGSICIYAAIAKKKTDILGIHQYVEAQKTVNKTIVVGTSSEDSPGEIFLCPYTAMTIAEYFRDKGRDVLLVIDDLSAHAKFYREISLVARRFPGRNSYPGDIFYIHSRLLERAGNFEVEGKEVSITCMPIAETVQGDLSGFVSTNVMSMTDGHIFFDGDLYFRGRRPAINTFLSVTRVGKQTQTPLQRDASRLLTDLITGYEKTQGFQKFGAELGENSRQILTMGDRVLKFFDQPVWQVVPENMQLVLLAMLVSGVWNGADMEKIVQAYIRQEGLHKEVDAMVEGVETMAKLIEVTRVKSNVFSGLLT